jgi:hypothetical protein
MGRACGMYGNDKFMQNFMWKSGRTRTLRDLGTDGKIMEWICKRNSVGRCGVDSCGSRQVPVVSSCRHSYEPLDSIKGGEFVG